ncbi:hypothetical protein NECAME_01108 [Necator americanus]|uniref:Uncharacterized protein n=1 Tax=Necator americanus TaxID=51031 RepID=W2SHG4_NECAM|nr:hypothetical protein NECAME_01108 [Necator americanus]ETN68998.1 hypothetical protein NECAME_01108 [Necator americanus]
MVGGDIGGATCATRDVAAPATPHYRAGGGRERCCRRPNHTMLRTTPPIFLNSLEGPHYAI